MDTEHTPGPWRVVMRTRIGINGPRDHIGWPAPVAYNLGFVTDETALANAHLMAAAPDLDDALSTLVQYAEWQIREGTDHHPTLPSAIGKAKEALAKARGKA